MSLKIRKQHIRIIATIFPFLMSEGMIALLGLNNNLVMEMRLIDIMVLLILCLVSHHKCRLSMIIMYIIYGTIFVSARFHGNLAATVSSLVSGFGMCIAFDYWLEEKYELFLDVLRKMLRILLIVNILSIVLFPNGLYSSNVYSINWFLGHKNSHMTYIMMAVIVESIWCYKKYNKMPILSIAYIVLCCISLYLVDSATAFIVVAIYDIVLIVFINKSNCRYIRFILDRFDIRFSILITLIITFIIVFLQNMLFLNAVFGEIFTSFNRDTSFTGRTIIWEKSIDIIKENIFMGQGVVNSVLFAKWTGIEAGTHAHNYILNIMVMSGIVGIVEHAWLYYYTIRNISRERKFYSYSLGLALGLYFISGLTGVNFYSCLFNAIFVLCDYVIENENGLQTEESEMVSKCKSV